MYGRYTIPCCEQRNLQMAENHCAYFHATGRFSDWCAARGIPRRTGIASEVCCIYLT